MPSLGQKIVTSGTPSAVKGSGVFFGQTLLHLVTTSAEKDSRPRKVRKIAIHESDEGYSVSVPGLPGCWSQGKPEAEALDNIKDAIREYLAVVDER